MVPYSDIFELKSSVCKSWRDEIGTQSPQLWKMLLNRHNWPFASLETDYDDLDAYRETFISHYIAVRDIRAIASASGLLCGENNDSNAADKDGLEFAMQRYKSTKGAPIFNGEAEVMVKVWSESVYAEKVGARALAGYHHDNTLRLFEVVPRNNSLGTKCRQIACASAVSPSVSRRRAGSYCLWGMALDEDFVACLFMCAQESLTESEDFFLSTISRDDLASAGNEGLVDDDSFREFDIRAMILDFFVCGAADEFDHLQTALHDYLSIGDGDTSFIGVSVSQSLVSCGQGYFLFLATITIPGSNIDSGDSDNESEATVVDTRDERAFLLSVRKGRIVKSVHIHFPRRIHGLHMIDMYASNPVRSHFSENASSVRKLCTNVVVKRDTDLLNFSVYISKNGTVDIQMKTIIEGQQNEPGEIMIMPVVVTSNCVISSARHTCLAFMYDREDEELLNAEIHRIEVGQPSEEIIDMFGIREEYVVVVLGTHRVRGNDEDAVAGEWFGLDEEQSPKKEVVVIHISSRQELFRCPVPNTTRHLFQMDCIGDTVAANVERLGFVIAGGNARDVARTVLNDEGDTSQTPSKTPKAKKKRLASLASGRKKDGFARGMSMRG